ncbi:hypothetical protein SAMN05216174_11812 [Actinokineospora iranica]|uniref:Uncharacterized protein n=2 Tax=Actinokineospora iranica TaxID=1271860 RepID=A0A1G6XLN0_9PSEU|nr:hypothetical protein SAMN05216174_11812 [Actinokineospora iranica]
MNNQGGTAVKMWETLSFELSADQEAVLAAVPDAPGAAAADGPLEPSYRAWNAHFVDPETTAR